MSAGNNQKTMSRLKKAFGNEKRIKILGYTTQMTLYMKACDVLLQSHGGLTSTEGAVAGNPNGPQHQFRDVKLPTGSFSEKRA